MSHFVFSSIFSTLTFSTTSNLQLITFRFYPLITTAFRVDNLSADDMAQVAAFKRMVKNSLMMDNLLSK